MEPYEANPAVEINTTVADDEEIISILPPVREMEPQIWKCSKCGESFPLKNELVNHLQKCLKSTNKFPCSLCGIKFRTDFGRDYHEFDSFLKMGEINEKFKCGVCGVDFYIEQNFKIHEREVCGKGGMGEDVECGVGMGVEATVGGGDLGGGDVEGMEVEGDVRGGELGGEDVEGTGVEGDSGGGELGEDVEGMGVEGDVGEEGGGDGKEEKIEKEEMKEEKEEREVEKGDKQEKEEECEWEMCMKCLEIRKNAHRSVDCTGKKIINEGYKLAVSMKSENLKKML